MENTYPFSLITLEGHIFEGPVVAISAPGEDGRFGVLAGHAQMVTLITAGQLDVTTEEGGLQHFVVSSGVCEVRKSEVVILAKKAEAVTDPEQAKSLLAGTYETQS